MLHPRLAPFLFALILSGVMSCIVSGISTVRVTGFADGVFVAWMSAWAVGWTVACPVAFFFGPVVRRIVATIVRDEA